MSAVRGNPRPKWSQPPIFSQSTSPSFARLLLDSDLSSGVAAVDVGVFALKAKSSMTSQKHRSATRGKDVFTVNNQENQACPRSTRAN